MENLYGMIAGKQRYVEIRRIPINVSRAPYCNINKNYRQIKIDAFEMYLQSINHNIEMFDIQVQELEQNNIYTDNNMHIITEIYDTMKEKVSLCHRAYYDSFPDTCKVKFFDLLAVVNMKRRKYNDILHKFKVNKERYIEQNYEKTIDDKFLEIFNKRQINCLYCNKVLKYKNKDLDSVITLTCSHRYHRKCLRIILCTKSLKCIKCNTKVV